MTDTLPFPVTPPSRFARALAAVLACANSSPPMFERTAFYAMKDAVLRQHGELVGADLQHIVNKCWGSYDGPECPGKGCRRCGGTGIYSEQWIPLERWELGGRIFHRPLAAIPRPDAPATISGRVTHERWSGHQPTEAALWLALAFDRRLFCRMMFRPSSGACGWFWMPMTNLSRAFFNLRMFSDRFRGRKCYCGRTYRRWFGEGGWCVCRKCRRRLTVDIDSEIIPF